MKNIELIGLRVYGKMSRKHLAFRLGIKESDLKQYENGAKIPSQLVSKIKSIIKKRTN